jgi:hypothetical protein
MWRELKVPYLCERAIGFSAPVGDEFWVISYEGLHRVRLNQPVQVQTDENAREYVAYDPDAGVLKYRGRECAIMGLHGGHPILRSPQGETLELDAAAEMLSIVQDEKAIASLKFTNFSGDWAVATFSQDGRYVVLGCPYGDDFVVLARSA